MPPVKSRNFSVASPVLFALIALFVSSARGQFTTIINVPPDPAPQGITGATKLNLYDGGKLPREFIVGPQSELNLYGGTVDYGLRVQRFGTVTNLGGSVRGIVSLDRGGRFEMTDGVVGGQILAASQSNVTISGGSALGVWAQTGGRVSITGGELLEFIADPSSQVTVSGGTIDVFKGYPGANIRLLGGEFRIDGIPVAELSNVGDSL